MRNKSIVLAAILMLVMVLAVACQPAEPQIVEVTRVVTEEVIVEGEAVEVTRVVTETVTEEVQVEVTRVVEAAEEVMADPFERVGDPTLEGNVSWYLGGDSPFYYEIAEAFMEEYPGINIEVMGTPWAEWATRFVTMTAAGEMPDVIWFIVGQPGMRLNPGNFVDSLVDLGPFLPEMEEKGFINDSLLEAAKVDGVLVGMPYEFNNIVLYYNKDLFDEAGLEYPNEDWTWEDMLVAGKALTKADGSQYGLFWNQFEDDIALGGAGTLMFNEDGTAANYDTPEAKTAYEFLYDIYVTEGIAPKPGEETGIGLSTGTAAMEIHGNWNFATNVGAEINFGTTLIPAGPAGHATLQRQNVWSVNKDAECLECALTFVKYLGLQGGLDRWAASGRLAPYESFTVDTYLEATGVAGTPYEETFRQLMDNVFANTAYALNTPVLPSFVDNFDIEQIINDQNFLLFAEQSQDIDQTLTNLQESLNAYLDAGWNRSQ